MVPYRKFKMQITRSCVEKVCAFQLKFMGSNSQAKGLICIPTMFNLHIDVPH